MECELLKFFKSLYVLNKQFQGIKRLQSKPKV